MRQVLEIVGAATPRDRERCAALAELLRRLDAASAPLPPAAAPVQTEAAAALLALAAGERLFYAAGEAVEVLYRPSRAALLQLQEASAGPAFPEPLHKKQLEALRSSQGALLRFPAEGGDRALEVFITDWSPCPAAAAVAVHRDHPWVAGVEKPAGSCFAGSFVRHPLTGDLLPVWIAEWVQPDFGTGAVLVNPAHDAADLAFGRAVGLPIRFGLVPEGFDGEPPSWPAPPVIKTGHSIKTGFYDGLPAAQALAQYFAVLSARGLAERYRDVQAGRARLGRLIADQEGPLVWDGSRRHLDAAPGAAAAARRVRVEASELLAAVLAAAPGDELSVVCAAAEQAKGLLMLRLLWFDLRAAPLPASRVVAVQKVQETAGPAAAPPLSTLALLIAAPPQQVAVLKQQVLDQAQRFVRVHGELAADSAASAASPAAAPPRALARAKEALQAGDPFRAFPFVQQQQKLLASLPAERRAADGALAGYFAVSSILAELPAPPGLDLAAAWQRL